MADKLLSVFIAGYLLGYILDGIYAIMNPPSEASENDKTFNKLGLLLYTTLFVLFMLVLMGVV
jgi:hypothetical protein